MFTRQVPTTLAESIPSKVALPEARFWVMVEMALAMPSASCLMVPVMEPSAIFSLAASVASTPKTGMVLPVPLL